MKIIYWLEMDKNAQIVDEKEMESQSEIKISSDNHLQKKGEEADISGQWLLLDELVEINNQYLLSQKDEEKEITWIRLPDKYVEEDYMVDYSAKDQCPLGVDVLIKEDGYPVGVIAGCDSIKQAKVDNNLDGHKYKGELGLKLNNDYFLTFKKESEEFKVVRTNVDWDRGKHTI
ncbi:MAG: hypothetical protein ABR547_05535 [Halanaerobium sp.]